MIKKLFSCAFSPEMDIKAKLRRTSLGNGTAPPLTAECVIAPVHGNPLLGAVLGVSGDDRTVTRPLSSAGTHLQQAQAEVELPLHHVMTRLQGQRARRRVEKGRAAQEATPLRHARYLEGCSVYDGAHCLGIMPLLGEGGAGVGWSSSRQKTVFPGEFLGK